MEYDPELAEEEMPKKKGFWDSVNEFIASDAAATKKARELAVMSIWTPEQIRAYAEASGKKELHIHQGNELHIHAYALKNKKTGKLLTIDPDKVDVVKVDENGNEIDEE